MRNPPTRSTQLNKRPSRVQQNPRPQLLKFRFPLGNPPPATVMALRPRYSRKATSDLSERPVAHVAVLPTVPTTVEAAGNASSLTAPSNVKQNRVSEPVVVRRSTSDISKQNTRRVSTVDSTKPENQPNSGAGKTASTTALQGSAASHDSQRSVHDRPPARRRVRPAWLLCLAVVALATSVALALVVFWWRKHDLTEPCVGFDCHLAFNYLRSLIDSDIEPCDDFYGHVCHKWDTDEGGRSFVDAAVRELDLALNWTILSIGVARERYYGYSDFVRFYAACHAFMARATDRSSREQEIELPLDLFPDDSSILHIREPAALLARVTAISLARGISTAFGVDLVRHRGTLTVYISRGRSLAEKLGERNQTRMLNRYLRTGL
ncbi:hypothetical protein MTO96_026370 [Rhipicephalus appendiculatus]